MTLNVNPYLSVEQWAKVGDVYRSMDGWIEGTQMPCWYGSDEDAKHIWASVEPGGLVFGGNVEPDLWTAWMTVICARLTLTLGTPVHDATM